MSGTLRFARSSILVVLFGLITTVVHGQFPTARSRSTHISRRPEASVVQPAGHALTSPEVSYDEGTLDCDTCDLGSANCGSPICASPLWGNVEYLLWWEQDSDLPPLVTTSPNQTPRDDAGVLGQNSTSVLLGGDTPIDAGTISGVRLMIGCWLDPCQSNSIVARGFAMEDHDASFAFASNGSEILARPFFNAFTGEQDALLLGFPNEIRGDVQVTQDTQTYGGQVFFRKLCRTGCNYRWDFVYGYRYLGVDETLTIDSSLEFIDPTGNAFGNTIEQFDLFEVENEFHGGELGLMGHSSDGRWTLDFLATVALGTTNQRATIRGNSTATQQGLDPVNLPGGLLAQTSNIGDYKDDPFTVVPEFNVTLGYMITPRLDFTVGYTFLYVNHVSRPGELIDSSVNLTQQTGNLQGPARPAFAFEDSDYWLQGINFGLSLRY